MQRLLPEPYMGYLDNILGFFVMVYVFVIQPLMLVAIPAAVLYFLWLIIAEIRLKLKQHRINNGA